MGLIHTGSGLGLFQFDPDVKSQIILEMRLVNPTILEAPVTLKQQLDIWGYSSNAGFNAQIKQQFDRKIFKSSPFCGWALGLCYKTPAPLHY